jgi:hypothetical protein
VKEAAILYRKSKHWPDKIACGIFVYVDYDTTYMVIERWKAEFVEKFPEFRDAEFTVDWTESFPASRVV